MELIKWLALGEEGASLAEEGLLIALVTLACIVALAAMGGSISAFFTSFASTLRSLAA